QSLPVLGRKSRDCLRKRFHAALASLLQDSTPLCRSFQPYSPPVLRLSPPYPSPPPRPPRPSSVFPRLTRPARTSPATMRLIVGGRTCSASASSPSDRRAPPTTRTDRAESCAGPPPLSRSRTRSRRNRWMAAECSRSAVSKVSPPARRLDLTFAIEYS